MSQDNSDNSSLRLKLSSDLSYANAVSQVLKIKEVATVNALKTINTVLNEKTASAQLYHSQGKTLDIAKIQYANALESLQKWSLATPRVKNELEAYKEKFSELTTDQDDFFLRVVNSKMTKDFTHEVILLFYEELYIDLEDNISMIVDLSRVEFDSRDDEKIEGNLSHLPLFCILSNQQLLVVSNVAGFNIVHEHSFA